MIPLKKLEVNAGQDALFEPSKVTEQSLCSVKVAELAVLTVVTHSCLQVLALVVQANLLVARAVSAILSDSHNQVVVAWAWTTAGWGI